MHPIRRLRDLGQSVWLDFIQHRMLVSGELEQMIELDGLAGITSNPTIFQKSIAASSDYDAIIGAAAPADTDETLFERIQVRDIALACDKFRGLYDRTGGADGFVSIEVAPAVARDTQGSIEQARRFWRDVGRPNLMVKIPGTREGVPAIERCLTEGINVNITLLFSVERYLEVARAYLNALEARAKEGKPNDRLASVASFFVSRIDTKVDKILDSIKGPTQDRAKALRGRIAIANAELAYDECERVVAADRFRSLASAGARRQRLLWASTAPKDVAYPAHYYADALVGGHTVDTMTLEIFRSYVDHGKPEARLARGGRAREALAGLAALGVDLRRITDELEDEGVRLFAESFDKAVKSIAAKRHALGSAGDR